MPRPTAHHAYQKPELLAEAPNQIWSWDITKLLGPTTWSYFHLYVILDIFSRYILGWTSADRESATLANCLEENLPQAGHQTLGRSPNPASSQSTRFAARR